MYCFGFICLIERQISYLYASSTQDPFLVYEVTEFRETHVQFIKLWPYSCSRKTGWVRLKTMSWNTIWIICYILCVDLVTSFNVSSGKSLHCIKSSWTQNICTLLLTHAHLHRESCVVLSIHVDRYCMPGTRHNDTRHSWKQTCSLAKMKI